MWLFSHRQRPWSQGRCSRLLDSLLLLSVHSQHATEMSQAGEAYPGPGIKLTSSSSSPAPPPPTQDNMSRAQGMHYADLQNQNGGHLVAVGGGSGCHGKVPQPERPNNRRCFLTVWRPEEQGQGWMCQACLSPSLGEGEPPSLQEPPTVAFNP